jgi:ornithine cyclodeaminase/alanine dehydrogenase-like protein (mu-crystallin family)
MDEAMLVITQRDVARLLPLRACMEAMRQAFTALAEGRAVVPQRRYMPIAGGRGVLGMMPAELLDEALAGIKVMTVLADNADSSFDSHRGAVLLFETRYGGLVATVDATAITAIRTAAVSGLATEHLARPDAADLAIIGSGTEAATHLAAMMAARPIRAVRVYSRSLDRATAFADRASHHHGIPITICRSAQEAVRDASIICTTTSARLPVLERAWIAPGTHLNAVGSSVATDRELDTQTVADATVIVDLRPSAVLEAGDIVIPIQEGAITAGHIAADLGEVITGRHPGRRSNDELTLFKSVGLGLEDVASAALVYRRAIESLSGTIVEFGGWHHASLTISA